MYACAAIHLGRVLDHITIHDFKDIARLLGAFTYEHHIRFE
jgi:hypothetical protein